MSGIVLIAIAAISGIPGLAPTSTVTCNAQAGSCIHTEGPPNSVVDDFVNGRVEANTKLQRN
jgi:hypothetical protein